MGIAPHAALMAGTPALLLADFSVLLMLIPILLWLGAAGWVFWDAVQRAGEWGFLWGVFALGAAPVVVPLYLICIVIADRPAPAWVQREKELATEATRRYKAMGELERVKFLEAAAGNGGTLYTGVTGMAPHNRGVKHFGDAHAEQLIGTQQFGPAFLYLYDMYVLAADDSDVRGEETYRHYIMQLPQGAEWLKGARDRQLSPGQLKAAGLKLLDSWSLPVDRSRLGTPDAASPLEEPADDALALQGLSLERMLNQQEPPPPPGPGQKPLSVKAARDPRAARRGEVPF
jgi:hypothetical protein